MFSYVQVLLVHTTISTGIDGTSAIRGPTSRRDGPFDGLSL